MMVNMASDHCFTSTELGISGASTILIRSSGMYSSTMLVQQGATTGVGARFHTLVCLLGPRLQMLVYLLCISLTVSCFVFFPW